MPAIQVSVVDSGDLEMDRVTSRCSTVFTANCISISSLFPAVSASKLLMVVMLNDVLVAQLARGSQNRPQHFESVPNFRLINLRSISEFTRQVC